MKLSEYYEQQKSEKTTLVDGRQPITDKGTYHDFINGYYDNLFTPYKDKEFTLLEIGVEGGYSMDLWRGYFTKATLFAIDLNAKTTIDRLNSTFENTKAFLCDGYNTLALDLFQDNTLDFIIEDGPHSAVTQIFAAQFWSKKLKPGGKLMIEDIQNYVDCYSILESIEKDASLSTNVIDLRKNKGRYDDIIVEITKKP